MLDCPFGGGMLEGIGKPVHTDKILHHFETMGNHCLLVFTRNQTIPGLLNGGA